MTQASQKYNSPTLKENRIRDFVDAMNEYEEKLGADIYDYLE